MPTPRDGFTRKEIVLGLALLAGLAVAGITAYSATEAKRRQEIPRKCVMSNTHMLTAAADQYFLENGVSTVRREDIVGATSYMKELTVFDREVYPTHFTQDVPVIATGFAGTQTVSHLP